MSLTTLLVFAGALMMAAGSPGPSIAALVARVLSRGPKDVMPFLAAMWIGEGVWLTCAVLGLAAIAETFHAAFVAIKWLGVAYLLYLAWKMWFAPTQTGEETLPDARSGMKLFFAGLTVTLCAPLPKPAKPWSSTDSSTVSTVSCRKKNPAVAPSAAMSTVAMGDV